jgi:Cyclic nucleotide-binding domain
MPGVIGSQRARPAATRQRQPENSVIAGPSAAAGPAHRAGGHAELAPGTGRGGILAARSWNPTQIAAFCPYIKSSGGHYDDGRAEHWSRRRSLLKIGWLPMDTSHLAEHAGAASSFFASIFVVATLSMRTMIPLRVFGILTNIILIVSAIPTHNYATLVLHSVLLPLNSYRLHQMLQLVRDVKKSVNSDLSMEWLKPFMTERKCAAGEVLFYKDEKAESMFYIVSGRYQLVESGIELPVGAIVGELGMLSPSNMRTQTLECIEAGTILSVSYKQVEELYVQNPAFGFYFLRLASARLFQNIGTLEQQLAQYTAPAPAAAAPKPA